MYKHNHIHAFVLISDNWNGIKENIQSSSSNIELKEGKRSDINTRKCMLFALGCFCLLPSAYLHCKKHEGGFVLILKSAWGVLSTLYFWAWGVLSAFKKTCGGFCPPIRKWTWGVLSVGCFVLHSR